MAAAGCPRRRRRLARRGLSAEQGGVRVEARPGDGQEDEPEELPGTRDDAEDQEEDSPDVDSREALPIHRGSRAWVLQQEGVDRELLAGCLERRPKKTYALVIGYDGRRYKGLQQASDLQGDFLHTVEAELEFALYRAGAISPANFGNLKKLGWTRAGRTDAGVSAACNVVTARLMIGDGSEEAIEALVARAAEFLPPEVVLHGADVVTKRFNARGDGSSREYVYLLPAFCVEPSLDQVRAGCEELGVVASLDDSATALDEKGARRLEELASLRQVRVSEEQLARFRKTLALFEGTHFFANFCNAKLTEGAPEAWRHMRRLVCGKPFVDATGCQWLPVEVAADSFLTHQIRKMLGTAAMVAQGFLPVEFVPAALDKRIRCKTPKLPPYGLMFLRPSFQASSRGQKVEDLILSDRVQRRIAAWRARLQPALVESQDASWPWARWLATIETHGDSLLPEALEAVEEHAAILHEQGARRAAEQQAVAELDSPTAPSS